MRINRRNFLRAAGCLAGGAMMPQVFAKRKPNDLGNQTGINLFAFDLHHQLRQNPGNLFTSPLSISVALAMTAGGADGRTLQQMAKTLRCPGTTADPIGHALFGELLRQVAGADRKTRPFQLDIANGLFAQKGYPWRDEFLKQVDSQYQAEIRDLDFVTASEAARKTINDWTESRTNHKIKDLLAKGVVDHSTRSVLVNAIYFQSQWQKPFTKSRTKDQPFQTAEGKIPTPTMTVQLHTRISETDELQFLELPYASSQVSMLVLLPRKVDGLATIEKSLDAVKWNQHYASMQSAEVEVHLPKFRLESKFDLDSQLKALGMTDAFDTSKANFSRMTRQQPEGPFAISKVVHQSYCDVDEAGTEAAAATGVVVAVTSARIPQTPKIFRADRPFLFAIRHNPTQTLLFLGRMTNPKV